MFLASVCGAVAVGAAFMPNAALPLPPGAEPRPTLRSEARSELRTEQGVSPADRTVAEGAKLFVAYNCADCHGAAGSGAMAPSLADNRWKFGGSAEDIAVSIAMGRPEGMPGWGGVIPRAQFTALVAYVRTLGNGKDVTTENFTGETVERGGR